MSRVAAAVLTCGLAGVMAAGAATPVTGRATPVRGLTAAPQVARAYDAVLNADFEHVPTLLVEPSKACGRSF